MNSLEPIRTAIRPQRKSGPDPAEVRERAAALFGTAVERGAREGPPGARSEPPERSGPSPESTPESTPEPSPESTPALSAKPSPEPLPLPLPLSERPAVAEEPTGPVRRLRTWLFVRCGLEFKTVLALVAVLVIAGGLAVQHFVAGRPRTIAVPPPLSSSGRPLTAVGASAMASAATTTPAPKLTVDIAGKVAKPGLRRLPSGSRVADALSAAGGALPGTDTSTLNLARPLTDGEQILVGIAPAPGAPADPGDPAAAAPASPVSLNSATAAQLDALPGVGPVLAQHILDFRTQHGSFTSVDQLRQVPGIGDRKFTTLKPLVHP
ncbi:helix-hairpin-helix domain-containing protein [Streptomyces sp. NPDC087422]|uniref:helix-hairpin-helix domain-containing protein n=1 Tax=Streptomyces sp. NPDC087422 TaxID=3365786 RepID=UPI003812F119